MPTEIEPKKNLSEFLTPTNIVIVFVSIVGVVTLVFWPSDAISKIVILVVVCGILWYTITSVSKIARAEARDYIPLKDREMLEKLIAENNKAKITRTD
jgi:hypothetical protein